jgi:thiamine pyrophosphate-dependent acetolactate synthase large subunit-like protein
MRKTITGTGGMLLVQTLKDAGVGYLFTNPGSAETGIFAALAEDGDQRLVVGKHEGLVAAMADGYHRLSGKVGVIIAHVMGLGRITRDNRPYLLDVTVAREGIGADST